MKEARWREHVSAFQRYRASSHPITVAEALAARERGVDPKTIFNARKWAKLE